MSPRAVGLGIGWPRGDLVDFPDGHQFVASHAPRNGFPHHVVPTRPGFRSVNPVILVTVGAITQGNEQIIDNSRTLCDIQMLKVIFCVFEILVREILNKSIDVPA